MQWLAAGAAAADVMGGGRGSRVGRSWDISIVGSESEGGGKVCTTDDSMTGCVFISMLGRMFGGMGVGGAGIKRA